MNKRIKLVVFLLCLLSVTVAHAKSEDYLECDLANGDQFILINKYDYSPLARFTRHGASRTNQFGFLAYFKPKDNKVYKDTLGNFGRFNVADEMQRKEACADFFMFAEKVQSTGHEYKLHDNKVLNESIMFPSKEIIKYLDRNIDGGKLYTPESPVPFQLKYNNDITVEFGLTKKLILRQPSIIDAVIQTQSTDNGQTWSDPIITKDAKLFEIGKSILDQPAVAKPGKWKKGPG